jgi:hypothetical protein
MVLAREIPVCQDETHEKFETAVVSRYSGPAAKAGIAKPTVRVAAKADAKKDLRNKVVIVKTPVP